MLITSNRSIKEIIKKTAELSKKCLQITASFTSNICDVLRDLVLFVQFKKREKHPWRSINFSKVAGFSLQLY